MYIVDTAQVYTVVADLSGRLPVCACRTNCHKTKSGYHTMDNRERHMVVYSLCIILINSPEAGHAIRSLTLSKGQLALNLLITVRSS